MGNTRGRGIRRLRDTCERGQHLRVLLASVRLPRNGEHAGEAHPPGNTHVEVAYLVVVAVEQVQEARLRARGPFPPPELQGVEPMQQLLRVEQELLHPQGDALANRRQLRIALWM